MASKDRYSIANKKTKDIVYGCLQYILSKDMVQNPQLYILYFFPMSISLVFLLLKNAH